MTTRFPKEYGHGERVLFGDEPNSAEGALYLSDDGMIQCEVEGTDNATGEDVLHYLHITVEQARAMWGLLGRAIKEPA